MSNFLIRLFLKDEYSEKSPKYRLACGKIAGLIGIFSNILLFILKIIAGLLTKSMSLIADSLNNLSDASSSIINFIGFKLSSKPADGEHPYGHGRYEYISALSVSVLVLIIGIELLKSGFLKIINPTPFLFSYFSLAVLFISVILKGWLYLFNLKLGKKINSSSLKATAIDSRNDVFISLSVLVSVLLNKYFNINIDGFIAVGVSLFIIYSGYILIKDTINPLLGNAPDEELVQYINKKILSYPEIFGTHDLIIHDYGPGRLFASIHVEVAAEADVIESHDRIDNIERDFLFEDNINLIIHSDPIVTKDKKIISLKNWFLNEIKEYDQNLDIHDLRIVFEDTLTNFIFDCVIPHNSQKTTAEIKKKINEILNKKEENFFAIITFESNYS